MKDLPEALTPIFWIEESVALNATYVDQLKDFFKLMKIMNVVKWVVLSGSMLGMGVGGFLFFKQTAQVDITPVKKVHPANGQSKPTSVISLVHQNGNDFDGSNRTQHSFEKY